MTGFLETVVAAKQRDLARRQAALSADALRERGARTPVRDFRAAVSAPGAVIAEIKLRTPTIASFPHAGPIEDIARAYEASGAAAISIVTDPDRFGTSLEDVARVRAASTLPVIAKDFVIDPYQVLEARAAGADAVLLIVRLLHLDSLRSLLALVHATGMSALVETHTEPEILAALSAGARIVGINNRDLDTMTVSLDATRRLAHLVPREVVCVAESGIRSRADVDDLAAHGASAFLVGASLLESGDPGAKLGELTRRESR